MASSYGEEDVDAPADELVRLHAREKARDVAARAGIPPGGAVLGADTAVVLDGAPLGKPEDRGAAVWMISSLAGREHLVMTGVALLAEGVEEVRHAETVVRFRPLSHGEVEWYVGTGEWRDRAGGYAIQGAGAAIVAGIVGDHSNVVGLPVPLVAAMLGDLGLAPWSDAGAGPG